MTACNLSDRSCKPCEGGVPPLDSTHVAELLKSVPGWSLDGDAIVRRFEFRDYHQAIAFVNATAWISHRENHHPDMEVGYNRVTMRYSTHAIGGLSENDFICAAKVNALL